MVTTTDDPEDDDLFLDGIDEGALARWEEGALMNQSDREILQELVEGGLTTDGGYHKQWFLEQIVKQLELPITVDYEPGEPPRPTMR